MNVPLLPSPVVPSPWPAVLLLYAAGLMAAAQLGKMSALVPVIGPALGLSLMSAAWAVSLLEIGGATLGTVASGLALRLGLWRSLRWGLVALAVAGLGSASAAGELSLMLWRLLEAAGYLGVTVSAPVLMVRLTAAQGSEAQGGLGGRQPRAQMLAMTLWSTFVSVGVALGASGAAAAAVPLGWRGTLLAGGLLAAALALATRALAPAIRPDGPASHTLATQAAPVAVGAAAWCLALGFGLFALFAVGVMALLPTFLVDGAGLSAAAAGQWTGLASLSAVAGSALGAVLLRLEVALRWPTVLALALPAGAVWGVFAAEPHAARAVVLAIAIHVLGGLYACLAFTALPRLVSGPAQLVRANGLITQFGASGSLLGAPMMAAGASHFGWPGGAAAASVAALLAVPLAWRAMRGL